MPNFATALKEEITRLARKEVKAQLAGTQKSVVQYRHEIAALKRQIKDQAQKIERLRKLAGKNSDASETPDSATEENRFSARSVRAQRERLGLSAKDYGSLIGVTGLTIYNWEHGKSRPRKAQFESLVAIRGIGKREAKARLSNVG